MQNAVTDIPGICRMGWKSAMTITKTTVIPALLIAWMRHVEMDKPGTLMEEVSNATMEMMTTAIHAWILVRLQIA